jgi:hypothetical protein
MYTLVEVEAKQAGRTVPEQLEYRLEQEIQSSFYNDLGGKVEQLTLHLREMLVEVNTQMRERITELQERSNELRKQNSELREREIVFLRIIENLSPSRAPS